MTIAQTTSAAPSKRDHRQEVTDSIIRMLEEGVAPWQKPWQGAAMPFNPTTDKAYRGGNAIHLLAAGLQRGFEDPRWMTYKQAAENGWQVRQGERGTHIEFWDVNSPVNKAAGVGENADPPEKETDSRLIHRVYTVFNADQIDGVPKHEGKPRSEFEAVQSGECILANSGAIIVHDQRDRAFYSHPSDTIHLPPKEAFKDAAGFYGTALHELAHWSGHPSRLNRPTLTDSYQFGDINYAKEELRAELASLFLAAELGVPHDPANHAAYVGSWIKSLRDDKNELFRAARDASTAADFVLALDLERSRAGVRGLEQGQEQAQRENSRFVARVEPGTGTVAVHDKRSVTDHHTPVETASVLSPVDKPNTNGTAGRRNEFGASFAAAKGVTAQALGDTARTYTAQTLSGTYSGKIIGETDHHVVQVLSGRSAVAHMKHLLEPVPRPGENVSIRYANDHATLRNIPERAKAKELSR